eukprot:5227898-Amphidinium_carterae.2
MLGRQAAFAKLVHIPLVSLKETHTLWYIPSLACTGILPLPYLTALRRLPVQDHCGKVAVRSCCPVVLLFASFRSAFMFAIVAAVVVRSVIRHC